jgi:hypothetical protein
VPARSSAARISPASSASSGPNGRTSIGPQPDAAQAALLDRLGIVLPKRMRMRIVEHAAPPPEHPTSTKM